MEKKVFNLLDDRNESCCHNFQLLYTPNGTTQELEEQKCLRQWSDSMHD